MVASTTRLGEGEKIIVGFVVGLVSPGWPGAWGPAARKRQAVEGRIRPPRPRIEVARRHARAYPAGVTTELHTRKPDAAGSGVVDPEGLREFLQQAENALVLRRVYLFGSRARGDAREDSDLDLAFEHDSSPSAWADFVNLAREQAPLLLDLDLVDLSRAAPELRERILEEGRLLRG